MLPLHTSAFGRSAGQMQPHMFCFSYVVIDLSLDSMHAFLIVLLHRTSEIAAWPSGNVLGLRWGAPRLQSQHGVHIWYREFDLLMSSCPEFLPL